MLEMLELWEYLPRKTATREWNQSRRKKYVAVSKDERVRDLKSTLTSDMEMRNLEFVLLLFGIALFQYFLTMLSFLPSRMVMYILCYCMLEVCGQFLILILQEVTVKRLP